MAYAAAPHVCALWFQFQIIKPMILIFFPPSPKILQETFKNRLTYFALNCILKGEGGILLGKKKIYAPFLLYFYKMRKQTYTFGKNLNVLCHREVECLVTSVFKVLFGFFCFSFFCFFFARVSVEKYQFELLNIMSHFSLIKVLSRKPNKGCSWP